jgi:hypothetical protein
MDVDMGLRKDWLMEGVIIGVTSWAVVLTPPGSAGAVKTVGIASVIMHSRAIDIILQRISLF